MAYICTCTCIYMYIQYVNSPHPHHDHPPSPHSLRSHYTTPPTWASRPLGCWPKDWGQLTGGVSGETPSWRWSYSPTRLHPCPRSGAYKHHPPRHTLSRYWIDVQHRTSSLGNSDDNNDRQHIHIH